MCFDQGYGLGFKFQVSDFSVERWEVDFGFMFKVGDLGFKRFTA